ncbi:hypothetical protein N8772_02095 [Rickettsiales bacterium]|nr:hypothetical protein [Rickettsiales bacterium]
MVFITLYSPLANEPEYLISNIKISEESNSASNARKLANIHANRQSFVKLLRKLSIDESFSNHIDDEQLEEAIIAKTISDEKIADNWYQATFNIEFSKNYIDNLLENKDGGNQINLDLDKKYLIFPIEIKDKKPQIWHKNNIWLNSWEHILQNQESQNIKIPKGDIDDISLLTLKEIDKIKYPDIMDILKKYDSKMGAFIDIYIDHLENNAAINITIIQKFTKKKIKLSFVNVNDIKKDRLYHIITEKVIEYLKNKDLSKINTKYQKKKNDKYIDIDILPSSLKSWVIFKQNLEKLQNIKFKIISISSDLIKLTLMPKGDVNIIKQLEDNNIIIDHNEDEKVYYIILE